MRQSKAIKPTKAWAVVDEKGRIIELAMLRRLADKVIADYEGEFCYDTGWQVVPVLISPVGRKAKK